MKITETELPGVLVVQPKVFTDDRGFFLETYREKEYQDAGIPLDFVQDNHSRSVKGTLRGLHYQIGQAQDKLVRCIRGKIFDVAVDIRKGSETFGRWVAVELSDDNHLALLVPEGFAHGFYALEDCDVTYKCSRYFAPDCDRGVIWNDPEIGIEWPAEPELVSVKDSGLPRLGDILPQDLPRFTGA